MALDDVAAHRVAGAERRLEVDARPGGELPSVERDSVSGTAWNVEPVAPTRLGREADAVDRDGAADLDSGAVAGASISRRTPSSPPVTATTDPTSRTIPVNML